MNRLFLLTITAVALTVSGLVPARGASSGLIVTFDNIPHRVRRDNPHLAAARLRIQEAIGHMQQAGRRSNPELEGGFARNATREGSLEIALSQRFPITNRLQLEKNISAIELKAAEAEVREVERLLVGEARRALVEVLTFRQRRALLKQQAAVSTKLAEFIKQAAEKGEESPIDAAQSRLEAAGYSNEIRQLQANETAAIATIKPLLGMKVGDVLNVSGTLPEATLPAPSLSPDRRPDYQAAQLAAHAAAENVELEKSRRYEDIEAGLAAGLERTEDAPEGLENEAIVGLRFKLALPFWDRNEGNIRAAQARATRKEKESVALAHRIRHEAHGSHREMAEWIKMLQEITGTLLPLAAEQAEAAESAYREGFADLTTVLRAREQELKLAHSRIEALRSFHLARIRFETAIARP